MGSPQREWPGIGGQLRCRSFALPSLKLHVVSRQATHHSVMPGARAIGLRAQGLSPHVGTLVVDGPCPRGLPQAQTPLSPLPPVS